jgi:hypothetical protein
MVQFEGNLRWETKLRTNSCCTPQEGGSWNASISTCSSGYLYLLIK